MSNYEIIMRVLSDHLPGIELEVASRIASDISDAIREREVSFSDSPF